MNITPVNNNQPKFGMNVDGLRSSLKEIPSETLHLTDELVNVVNQLAKHEDPYTLNYEPFMNKPLIDGAGSLNVSKFSITKKGTEKQVDKQIWHFYDGAKSAPKKITEFLRSLLKDLDNNKLEKEFKKQISIDAQKDFFERQQKELKNQL